MNTLPRWLFVLEEYIGKLNLHIQTDLSFNTFHVFSAFCSRISLTLACPMDLRLYPLDKQVCVLQIASCKYTILFKRLILRPIKKGVVAKYQILNVFRIQMVGRRMTWSISGKKKIQYRLCQDYTYHDLPWSNIKVHTVMLLRIQVLIWYKNMNFVPVLLNHDEIFEFFKQTFDLTFRWIQLSKGGVDLQAWVFLLPYHYLRSLLYACHRFVGLILVRSKRHSGKSFSRSDHLTYHVDTSKWVDQIINLYKYSQV